MLLRIASLALAFSVLSAPPALAQRSAGGPEARRPLQTERGQATRPEASRRLGAESERRVEGRRDARRSSVDARRGADCRYKQGHEGGERAAKIRRRIESGELDQERVRRARARGKSKRSDRGDRADRGTRGRHEGSQGLRQRGRDAERRDGTSRTKRATGQRSSRGRSGESAPRESEAL